jgi:hypothetical protein
MAFAEQGRGRPAFALSHSAIHARRVGGPTKTLASGATARAGRLSVTRSSAAGVCGGATAGVEAGFAVGTAGPACTNEDASGAKTIVSV